MIVQGALVGPVVRRLRERSTLITGIAFGAVGFLTMGLAPSGELFLLSIPFAALWGLAGPSGMTLMSARVSASEQGQLQGANNSLRAISELIGPSIFTLTFAHFIGPGRPYDMPGAPFLLASGLLVSSVVLALKVAARAPCSIETPLSGGAAQEAEGGH